MSPSSTHDLKKGPVDRFNERLRLPDRVFQAGSG